MMEAVLEELMQSPKLELYYRQIQAILLKEQEKRRYFYEEITEQQKAEFINGEVIVHSPVRIEHNITVRLLLRLLDLYVQINGLGFVGYEKMLVSLTRNDYEPDICFWDKKTSAGFKPGQTRFPAPDFIAEVLSPGTEKNDRSIKFEDYAAHGVREYWIVDTDTQMVEQYLSDKGQYMLHVKTDTGKLKSHTVRGFEIPVNALFDEQVNLLTLREILK